MFGWPRVGLVGTGAHLRVRGHFAFPVTATFKSVIPAPWRHSAGIQANYAQR